MIKTSGDADIATLTLPSHAEHCITVPAGPHMNQSVREAAQNLNASVLSRFVFAGRQHYSAFSEGSAVWLQGDACSDGTMHSLQAVAVSGLELTPLRLNGRDIGFTYEDPNGRYCRLSGIIPQDVGASRMEQTRSAFETACAALNANGFEFTDTIRTWIYLDRLLEWYGDFNTVRTQYFNETGIFDHMVPASTGIGACNPFGAAITMDVLAVQPKNDLLKIQEIVSPLQNPALDYKSAFSRAIELACPTHRSVLISGTASIDPGGKTVYLDDPEKQIRLTMDVIKAILESRGMGWGDLFRGIAYFKNMDFLPIYRRIAEELGISRFPLAVSHADVCRRDLLFEIEVDAVKTK
jgi:enamine deaminase RidA (YjgF/YER057c/UK114 family)